LVINIDRISWGRLMNRIYGNPVETEVDLISRNLSVWVYIYMKYCARYICARM
jgi:hypothetical protein